MKCFVCGGDFSEMVVEFGFIRIERYATGLSKKCLDFHPECFEEIAGQEYSDELMKTSPPHVQPIPPRRKVGSPLIKKVRVMGTGKTIPIKFNWLD